MRKIKMILVLFLAVIPFYGQQKTDDKKKILALIDVYSKSVIAKDSIAFYDLFNEDNVTWCAGLKDRSQVKEVETKGLEKAGSNYFLQRVFEGFV